MLTKSELIKQGFNFKKMKTSQHHISKKVREVINRYVNGEISANDINKRLVGIAFVTKVQKYFGLCNYTYNDKINNLTVNDNL